MIDEARIWQSLAKASPEATRIHEILEKASLAQGLDADEMASLCCISDPEQLAALFDTARRVKETIYGRRLVIFAPLYISNLCANECLYCAFRAKNKSLKRRSLSQEEIRREVDRLLEQGHKRVLLVAGEAYPRQGFDYVIESIESIYDTRRGQDQIRRINVNVAPLSVPEFRRLHEAKIGTYQLFQETYHRETYHAVHTAGRKADYDWRIGAMDRAMQGGIDDVGIGVLFGLADWRFELLALKQHADHLDSEFGVGPHTISVPRLEPASNSLLAEHPPKPVSDLDFRKLVAILRLALPYVGIILSTRENPNLRRETFALGVSQISAGSRTNPGGYAEDEVFDASQFSLGDHRPLDEVIRDITSMGFVPSFCTACYRLGRTGRDFMDMAKPGLIRAHCDPNALSSFAEYLEDFASPETRAVAEQMWPELLSSLEPSARLRAERQVEQIRKGERDVYC
ncbi:MAG: [FeFe] hydrogenase H-cluster radical SAM maturase HydG [Myxococcota bacterium]|jgi:2-iminoacetate synthase|nr:[FeFe] hydrogenase H-cluster radical SAM maturase HydG [Myxococcota bacterium]